MISGVAGQLRTKLSRRLGKGSKTFSSLFKERWCLFLSCQRTPQMLTPPFLGRRSARALVLQAKIASFLLISVAVSQL